MASLLPPTLSFHKPIKICPSLTSKRFSVPNPPCFKKGVSDFQSKSINFALSGALSLGLLFTGFGSADAKVGVNKPELLPRKYTPVIDIAGFLSTGQENRLIQEITGLEKDTGFKLRVLAQNYPETPGLAVKDFWQVDDRTIVFVADPTFGNILNFNVGASVDLDIPRSFWSRLAGKYGNLFYWKEKKYSILDLKRTQHFSRVDSLVLQLSAGTRRATSPLECVSLLLLVFDSGYATRCRDFQPLALLVSAENMA